MFPYNEIAIQYLSLVNLDKFSKINDNLQKVTLAAGSENFSRATLT